MSDCGSEQAPGEAARNPAASEDTRLPLHLAQTAKNPPAMQETRVQSLGQEDPLEEENSYPLQYSCLENPTDRGQRSLVG